jgi:Na+/H+ antiporter NhaD/arsenite permease-like protein
MFPIIILAIVFLLIAVRQVGRVRLEIWQVMCAGAGAVLLSGAIKPGAALAAIDWDVMVFLLGMFAAGQTLELSGWLAHAKFEIFKRARTEESLLLSRRRFEIIRKVDWSTLAFFAGMFVLMRAVWDTGFFQGLIARSGADIAGIGPVMAVSVVMSQLISNVPLVALYLPVLQHAGAGTPALMALAAASTFAGNLFILGAASNVIIIQTAEKRAGETITFLDFARVGVPLTALNAIIYWLFLRRG